MIRLAFTGNPNVGKSALINAIAGSKLKVGNWPGVTVEKKEATFTYKGEEIELVDLPGVYSLSPYSLEEKITRDFILEENPDVVINVVDSTNLERNLYLTFLIKELEKPTIMALNLYDEFDKLKYKLDIKEFENFMEMKAIPVSALKGTGITELMDRALELAKGNKKEKLLIKDEKGIEKEINPYLELTEEDIDPIEIYAYYIGSYINNMRNGIYLEYFLSFPVTYEKEIREKILSSFERGIKKSLPKVSDFLTEYPTPVFNACIISGRSLWLGNGIESS